MRAKLVLAIIAGLTMTVGLGTVLAGPKGKRPEARLADLRLTLALSEGAVAQGDVVPLRVTLTHEGKRPVKARWMCTCAPKNPGQGAMPARRGTPRSRAGRAAYRTR